MRLSGGKVMTNSSELYSTINDLFEEFQENHRKFTDKGNKAAATRARKSIGEIKKLVTNYRKQSVLESNQKKIDIYTKQLTNLCSAEYCETC